MIELKEHNQETYQHLLEMLQTENRVACVQPTGTGKSYIALKYIEEHPEQKILLLAPTDIILQQFRETVGEDQETEFFQNTAMAKYLDLGLEGFQSLFTVQWDVILMDEFHRVGADTWSKYVQTLLERNPQTIIIGLSATPIRYLDDYRNMGEEVFHGNYACHYHINEAWKQGILPIPKYVLTDYRITEGTEDYIRQRYPYAKSKDQIHWIVKHFLENGGNIHQILKDNLPCNNGKFIVFCSDAAHVKKMRPMLRAWLMPFNAKIHIYTTLSMDDEPDAELLAFKNDNSNSLRLLFCVERLNEGLHLSDLDGEFMLRPTMSPIIYLQQLGRVLNAGSTKQPVIFDLVNNFSEYRRTVLRYRDMSEEEIENLSPKERTAYNSYKEGKYDEFLKFDFVQKVGEICDLFDEIDMNIYEYQWNQMFVLLKQYHDETGEWPNSYTIYKAKKLGNWFMHQNKRYRKGRLSEYQLTQLKSIGFPFREKRFSNNEKFELLLEFITRFKREPKANEKYKGACVGYFLKNVRRRFQKGNLEDEWILKFDNAGIPLSNKRDNTHIKIICLIKEYLSIHHQLPLDRNIIFKGECLGKKINDIRSMYKKGYKIKQQYIDEYIKLGVIDDFTLSKMSQTDYNIELLQLYKKQFNQLPTTKSGFYKGRKIYNVLSNIRTAYKKNQLTEKQIQKINCIDENIFINVEEISKEKWTKMYDLVKEYKHKFGKLPTTNTIYKNEKIGCWLNNQKQLYKNGKLSREKIEALMNLSPSFFDTKNEKQERQWNEMYRTFSEFYQMNDRLPTKYNDFNYKKNRTWLSRQKKLYKKKKLQKDRQEKLEAIGVVFDEEKKKNKE